MNIGQIGLSLAKKTAALVKSSGKSGIRLTKPVKPERINLQRKTKQKTDTFVRKIDSRG